MKTLLPRSPRAFAALYRGKGYDGFWLKVAGKTHEEMVKVVESSLTVKR
jgi:hypothetical protein